MNASKRWLCKPYKTWNTFRSNQLQMVSCFYVIILTTAILPFHNQPVSHSPHSHTSCPLIQGSLELAPTNARSYIILAMKWRHHLCRGVISARAHAQKRGEIGEKNSEVSTTNLYCVKSEVTRGEASNQLNWNSHGTGRCGLRSEQ